jgi:hypothetical protein
MSIGFGALLPWRHRQHGRDLVHDQEPRGCALFLGVVIVAVTARTARGGAFARRTVVELREDARAGATSVLAIVANGQPLVADVTVTRSEREETHRAATVTLPDPSTIAQVTVTLPPGTSRDVKVWAHRVTAAGASEGLAALVDITCRGERRRFDMALSSGQAVATVDGAGALVAIALRDPDEG